jgi:hypothetical protein
MNAPQSHSIHLNNWQAVSEFLDDGFMMIMPSYLERATQGNYPVDAFSKGQLASKSWLLHKLYNTGKVQCGQTITILGCWIGSLVEFLITSYKPERIYGIDTDPVSIDLAEKFNQHHVQNGWQFKGVVADVNMLTTSDMEFQIGGELINVKPNVVINTSCEHMTDEWFFSASSDQLIVMQTNDSDHYDGHINTCKSVADMQKKYPLRHVLYAGEMVTPAYTRYMQIGYR